MARKQTGKQHAAVKQDPASSAARAELPFSRVILLFVASFILHTILNILVHENATVVIDEGLYTNIARSLAWEGKLAFRGQPVNYPYLLYPFLLVPIYRLNGLLGGDVFRTIQVFNTLLITSSVFPAYCFARDFTKDSRKSLIAAAIVALVPDMMMGGYGMTECVIWPLSLWMVFFCYRFYQTGGLKYGLLTALFTGLMFSAKPGAIAAGAVMLTVHFIRSFRISRERVRNSVLSLLLLLVSVGVVYGIFLLFYGQQDSLLGLYTKQTEEWKPEDALVAAEAVFLLILLFIFACGGIFGLFPVITLKEYEKTKRHFILAFVLGVLTAIVGTAVFVVPYKWSGQLGELPLHLRYCSMFVPVMYIFTADRDLESPKHKPLMIALAVFSVLSLFPGVRAGFVDGETGVIDSVTLDAFVNSRKLNGDVTGWILTVCTVVFSVLLMYRFSQLSGSGALKRKDAYLQQKRMLVRFATAGFALFVLFNSVCAYVSASIYIDPTVSQDALEVNQKTADRECLGVTQRYYDDIYSYWLDSRLSRPMQQVTIDQMFIEMEKSGGVYSPFVPVEQSPNVNNHATPDTDTLVLGMTIAEHMELSDSVTAEKTANGHFTIVRIQPSRRWADTMMYGLDDNALYPSVPAYIEIFDDGRNTDGQLAIRITASGSGTLYVNNVEITLDRQARTYELTIPFRKVVPVRAENGTVQIFGYSTGNP